MPKMRSLLAVMAVASVVGGLAANAAPINRHGAVPQAGSPLIAVGGPESMGYECFSFKGCKYCRACVQCPWQLIHCKKKRGR
jgi:hypothetical protein